MFDKEKNFVYCDWCYKILVKPHQIDDEYRKKSHGWKKCKECLDKETPLPETGRIEDLPDDFFAPEDPSRKIFGKPYKGKLKNPFKDNAT